MSVTGYSDIRIGFVGVGHWHAPMYAASMKQLGIPICGAYDSAPAARERFARQYGCPSYTSMDELFDKAQPEFVFAFGKHAEMTDIAAHLVDRNMPFVMEKPMGVNWRALAQVAERVRAKGLFAGVDLVNRTLPLIRRLIELKESGELGQVNVYHFQLYGGEPDRYKEWHCEWMLDPKQAGAGPLFNFGPHGVDLFLLFANSPIETVCCWMSHAMHRLPIEDYAAVTLTTKDGAIGTIEVSYLMPDAKYARHLILSTDTLLVSTHEPWHGVVEFRDGRTEIVEGEQDWATPYVQETLRRFQAGEPPVASIGDMVAVLRILNAAQDAARAKSCISL